MQTRNARSSGIRIKCEDRDELLGSRMAMLGLDLFESANNITLEEIMRRCADCGHREACAVDLKRDPNNPVWETYCPNAEALLGLAEASWHTH